MRWATGPTGTSILVGGGASRTIYYWHVRLASASHANLGEFRSMLPQDRNNFAVNKMQPIDFNPRSITRANYRSLTPRLVKENNL
jgi:hypothetical protein